MTDGKRFYSNKDVNAEMNAYFTGFNLSHYTEELDNVYMPKRTLGRKLKIVYPEK